MACHEAWAGQASVSLAQMTELYLSCGPKYSYPLRVSVLQMSGEWGTETNPLTHARSTSHFLPEMITPPPQLQCTGKPAPFRQLRRG